MKDPYHNTVNSHTTSGLPYHNRKYSIRSEWLTTTVVLLNWLPLHLNRVCRLLASTWLVPHSEKMFRLKISEQI